MTVLVVAPHPDDDILGVGGTIARLAKEGHEIVCCVATSAYESGWYSKEYDDRNRSQYLKALESLGDIRAEFLGLPTPTLDSFSQAIVNDRLKRVVDKEKPEELYIPHWGDLHKEHQTICQSALVASRPGCSVKSIYAYEVPSETGWSEPTGAKAFIPNVYVDITDTVQAKIKAMQEMKQQLQPNPSPRSIRAIEGLATYRGTQVGLEYAEAFELIREVK